MRIIPSLASANPLSYQGELERLGVTPMLHMDIEDGCFLPNITFGLKTVQAVAGYTPAKLDVHLIVMKPLEYLKPLAECGICSVSAHLEALDYPLQFLGSTHQLGMLAGLAINLKTPPEALMPFADWLDYVIVMTSEPDGGDCSFWHPSLDKLCQTRKLLPSHISLWADGGIGAAQLPQVAATGVDTVIMGRAIWNATNPGIALELLSKTV